MEKNTPIKKTEVLAIIPARGGSKGIPRKNIKLLAGKPLVAYTIEAALKSKDITRVVVSTDDEEIADISRKYGAEVIDRPKELTADESPTEPTMEHAIDYLKKTENYTPDIIVLLQPTSPLRDSKDIDEAFAVYFNEEHDSVLSVSQSHGFLWKSKEYGAISINYDYKNRQRRQDMEPEYKENGAIYINKTELFKQYKNRLGAFIGMSVMSEENSTDIDNLFGFWLCEQVIEWKTK